MRVEILENCLEPNKKTPDIFKKGEFIELPDDTAKILIDKGYAAVAEAPKAKPSKKKEEPAA